MQAQKTLPKRKTYESKTAQMRFVDGQRAELAEVFEKPLAYVPSPMFRRPRQMAHVMQETITITAGVNLSREEERKLFLQLNYAKYKVALIRKKLLQRIHWKKIDVMELLRWNQELLHARSKIVTGNVGLVLKMAKYVNYQGVEFTDLISEGSMALLRAAEKFDCERGFKFSTYACRAIHKAFSRVAKQSYRYRRCFPVQLDPALEKDNHLERKREEFHRENLNEVKLIMQHNLANLSVMERSVLNLRFSLDQESPQPLTLKQVGQRYGLSKERIRQIQNAALAKLRCAAEQRMAAS